ncbi:MAG TPA: phospho-N-acetylmuramoyl-pentapeptide-transferase [Gemmatimonadota bacterium]|nr:phospho-N-acetylmuramoyl-pentapeptide-transferase [Gemmatimonadota bacterium]
MLYDLLVPLADEYTFFNLFRYITFRAAYATVTALVLAFLLGPWVIRKLRDLKAGQMIRQEGPQAHYAKAGTPTMGGVLIILATVIPTLLWADLSEPFIQIVLVATLWMGGLGFLDDYLKVVKRQSKGLIAMQKIVGQVLLGVIIGMWLHLNPVHGAFTTMTPVPFLKDRFVDFGLLYIPFIILVVIASTNAVNLTDGLDGLAIGLAAIAAAAFAAFAYVIGRADWSQYLQILFVPGGGELTIYCLALLGAALGFLWFNAHPAQVFMGDTGSLALGGAFGTLAVLLKLEFVLIFVGGVFVIEALSVIVQVASFKLRGKRVFKMSPIHHHFELSGWPEEKIVMRFYILGILCALIAASTLKIR